MTMKTSVVGSMVRPSRDESEATAHGSRTGAFEQPEGFSGGDSGLLEAIVQMSLRLRLRGIGLEAATGLSGRELDLIALLAASGPTSVKCLVADLQLPRSTMTAIVDRLEDRGLVRRRPNPSDRRSVVLEATTSATDALLRYREGMHSFVGHMKKVLRDDEQETFSRLVRKMAETL